MALGSNNTGAPPLWSGRTEGDGDDGGEELAPLSTPTDKSKADVYDSSYPTARSLPEGSGTKPFFRNKVI